MIQERIWGKYSEQSGYGFYPLIAHLFDTAIAGKTLFSEWLRPGLQQIITQDLGSDTEKKVAFIIALHDIGKANPVFQGQLAAKNPNHNIREHYKKLKDYKETSQLYKDIETITPADKKTISKAAIKRHEQVGALHLFEEEAQLFDKPASNHWLSAVIAGHHGYFFEGTDARSIKTTQKYRNDPWKKVRDELIEQAEIFCDVKLKKLPAKVSHTTMMLLCGLVIVSDRIASGNDWVLEQSKRLKAGNLSLNPLTPEKYDNWWKLTTHMKQRIENLLGFYHPLKNAETTLLQNWSPRPAQLAAKQDTEGLLTIMSSTGSGKTEAALLRHANRQERLAFLLPTTATTNAMMRRLQNIYENTGNIASLAHSKSILEDFYNQPENINVNTHDTDEEKTQTSELHPTEFVRSKSARLLAPICVATVDQAAMASLPLKWTALRLLALANAHIVLDEIHTLDAYQTRLIEPLMTWLGSTSTRVTLLSATMPHEHLEMLTTAYQKGSTNNQNKNIKIEYEFPAVVLTPSNGPTTTTRLNIEKQHDEYQIDYDLIQFGNEENENTNTHLNWAKEMRKKFPQARLGIFVNTISRAQNIARDLRDSGQKVITLHSRLTNQHRSDVEKTLNLELGPGGKAQGITLVGTQAIESSLDIDLDLISTDLAPAPSLTQRFGRAWRRQDKNRDKRIPGINHLKAQIVYGPDESTTANNQQWWLPYCYSPVNRTLQWLQTHHGTLQAPTDIQGFIEASWVSVTDLQTEADFDYFSKEQQGKMKAAYWTDSWKPFFDGNANINTLKHLTSWDVTYADGDSPLTRFIENETVQVILTGKNGVSEQNTESNNLIPGLFSGDLEQLSQKKSSNTSTTNLEIKEVLRCQISVSSKKMKKILREKPQSYPVLNENAPSLLTGNYILKLGEDFGYDPTYGLYLL